MTYSQMLVGLFTLAFISTGYTNSQVFDKAIDLGNQANQASGLPSGNVQANNPNLPNGTSVLPSWTETDTTVLKSYYKEGRNGAESINKIMQKGGEVKSQSSTCGSEDYSCKALKTTITNYDGIGNKYQGSANSLLSNIPDDPLSVLGIGLNIPAANAGSICVETTATTDPSTEQKICLKTQYKSLNILSKIPVTTGSSQTTPVCIDPDMSLSADSTVCSKKVYSCPVGSSLYGKVCKKITDAQTIYSGPQKCSNTELSSQGYKHSKNSIKLICEGDEIKVSARGAGSDGGGIAIGDFWGVIDPSVTYDNTPIVPVAGDWSGKQRQGVLDVTGFCADGTCSYNFKMGRSSDGAWVKSTAKPYCSSGTLKYDSDGDPYCSGQNFSAVLYSYSCPSSYLLENIPYDDDEKGAGVRNSGWFKITAMCGRSTSMLPTRWEDRVSFESISFADPREPILTCPSDEVLNGTECIKTFPATESSSTAQPGCLGGAVYSEGQLIKTDPTFEVVTNSDEVCPTGYYQTGSVCRISQSEPVIETQTTNCQTGVLSNGQCLHEFVFGGYSCPSGSTFVEVVDEGILVCSNPPTSPTTYTEQSCPSGYSLWNSVCSKTLAQQTGLVEEGVCSSTTYSCPNGMAMNGHLCEDVERTRYVDDPRCVNLGYDPNIKEEVFYCDEAGLDECSDVPSECVETGEICKFKDDVVGSPTFGQCLASEKTFECPVPGKDVITQSCGFNPLCMDGNCFTPPANQCTGVFKTVVNPIIKSCYESTPQDIRACPLEVYNDFTDGEMVQKGRPSSSCNSLINDHSCKQIEIRKNSEGEFPSSVHFSCLGIPTQLCTDITSDPTCENPKKHCNQYEDLSGLSGEGIAAPTTGRCLDSTIEYSCTETYSVPSDQCTEDMAKTMAAMELSRQSAEFIDPNDIRIFGGDYARCDRRVAAWAGGGFGAKSCCNISAPDPKSDHDLVKSQTGYSDISLFVDDVESVSNLTYNILTGNMDDLSTIQGATASANLYVAYSAVSAAVEYAQVFSLVMEAGGSAALAAETASSFASYSPWGVGFAAALAVYMNYQEALACDEDDYKAATMNKAKLCYPTKSFCATKNCGVFGCVCAKYRTSQCCYNSKLARIINDQGKRQLGISRAEDLCDGFTIDQIESLDWSKIDLTEFINELVTDARERMPKPSDFQQGIDNNKNKYQNSNGQLSKPSRLNM